MAESLDVAQGILDQLDEELPQVVRVCSGGTELVEHFLCGGRQSERPGDVFGATSQASLLPPGFHHGADPRLAAQGQKASPPGTVELVSRHRDRVHARSIHVEGYLAVGLHEVHVHVGLGRDATHQLHELLQLAERAELIVSVQDGDHPDVGSHELEQGFGIEIAVASHRHPSEPVLGALEWFLEGQHRWMICGTHENPARWPHHGRSQHAHHVRLASSGREHQFRCPEGSAQKLARILENATWLATEGVTGRGIPEVVALTLSHGLHDRPRWACGGGVVQKDGRGTHGEEVSNRGGRAEGTGWLRSSNRFITPYGSSGQETEPGISGNPGAGGSSVPIEHRMWPWILGGWTILSVLVAALFHRTRRSQALFAPQWLSFLKEFEEELTNRHPDVSYCGLVPKQMAVVIRVREQETSIPLGRLYGHFQAFPEAMSRLVDQLVEDIVSAGLHYPWDHAFSEVAMDILPQIRSRDWAESRRFGDGGLVYRALGDDLVVSYVIDGPGNMIFVCRAHLKQWGRSEEDLYRLASGNLERLCEAPLPREGDAMLMHSGDGYDAARVLLLDPESDEKLLVAMPDRDVLWIGAEEGQDLSLLMAVNEELNRNAAHPVSPHVYRWSSGHLEAVSDVGR